MARLEARLGALNAPAQETGDRSQEEGDGNETTEAVVADAEAGAPIGPGADEEAAFLATQRAVEGPPSAPAEGEEPAAAQKLPPLDGLVGRIPPEVLAALDDLFRAKFTAVRRVPASVLK